MIAKSLEPEVEQDCSEEEDLSYENEVIPEGEYASINIESALVKWTFGTLRAQGVAGPARGVAKIY